LAHHPRHPPKVFERVARMMLLKWGDAWPPWDVGLEDRVEDGNELAHGGDQCDLDRLACRAQMQVVGAQHWIASHCGDRGDI
jgi:hypothetical protein